VAAERFFAGLAIASFVGLLLVLVTWNGAPRMVATRFPGNCLMVALAAWLLAPRTTRIRAMRNRAGRWHVYWEMRGQRFEFYTPGASSCGYLRNALRLGQVRRIGN
jgi:hypothetical protein